MKRLVVVLVSLVSALVAVAAFAQAYPTKPIRIIVPWPAGGTVDGVARIVGPKLADALGRPVLVENKAGASGSIGEAEAA